MAQKAVWPVMALATNVLSACDNSTFPLALDDVQIFGLTSAGTLGTWQECEQKCCDDDACQVWQWASGESATPMHSCWVGELGDKSDEKGWVSRGRMPAPTPPPPPSPPLVADVDDSSGLGLRYEGIGAISGGGATTKLLLDYDKDTVSDILDFLFVPNFGLNLDILKVELGGDTDATEGAEPSHMHEAGDENYERGYEWWLMKEAKKRNPDIKLYGLPWGWPGWLDPSASSTRQAKDPFADPAVTANYTLAWLLGAKREHGLHIDYIGQWNERDAPAAYNAELRKVVAAAAPDITVLNRLPHYPGTTLTPDPKGCSQYEWNTTDGSRWVDEEGSVADGQSARCLARCVNRNYVTGCHTSTFQWHLISSFYDYLPWKRCGVAVANTPWSGSYEVTSPTWAFAHTSQFARVGWRFLQHGKGVGFLKSGGSYVARMDTNTKDLSIVVEKMTHEDSACARGSNPKYSTSAETVEFVLGGSFSKIELLHVWFSDLTLGELSPSLFVKQDDLPVTNGKVSLTIGPNQIYTLTTLSTGHKGEHSIPPKAPFPLPFMQDFEAEAASAPPALWYDQMGAWEVQASADKSHGNVMRQVVPVWPACWGYSCDGPTTYFGPDSLVATAFASGIKISVEVELESEAEWSLLLTNNLKLAISTNGTWAIGTTTGQTSFTASAWHQVEYLVTPSWQAVNLDGKLLGNVTHKAGAAGHIAVQLDRYIFASMDNFQISAV